LLGFSELLIYIPFSSTAISTGRPLLTTLTLLFGGAREREREREAHTRWGLLLQPCGTFLTLLRIMMVWMGWMDGIEIWHYIPHRIKNRIRAGQAASLLTETGTYDDGFSFSFLWWCGYWEEWSERR